MRVRRISPEEPNTGSIELLDNEDKPIPIVSSFLHHLQARGYSPNTLLAYAYDLAYFMRFLAYQNLSYDDFRPPPYYRPSSN